MLCMHGTPSSMSTAGRGVAYSHEGDKGVDALALDVMGYWHHRCLCDQVVGVKGTLHFRSPNAVPAHIDHVVHPPCTRHRPP